MHSQPSQSALSALVIAIAFAGCLQAPALDGNLAIESQIDRDPVLTFSAPVVATTECRHRYYSCFETTVAVDNQGRFLATSGYDPNMWRSDDGFTFEKIDVPAPVLVEPACVGTGDNTVQTGPDGRIYFSALRMPTPSDCDQPGGTIPTPHGVQVAITSDAGKTWDSNTFILVDDPAAPSLLADRQWLTFGENNEVFLTFQIISTGLVVARSTDGGATFERAQTIIPHNVFGTVRGGGKPLVARDGALLWPHSIAEGEGGNRLVILRSTDDGQTFTPIVVREGSKAEDGNVYGLPSMAQSSDGTLHIAWIDVNHAVHLSSSRDLETWSEPLHFPESPEYPWLGAGRSGIDLMVLDGGGEDEAGIETCTILIYRFLDTPSVVPEPAVAGVFQDRTTSDGCTTDFAFFAYAQEGDLVVPWGDGFELMISRETIRT